MIAQQWKGNLLNGRWLLSLKPPPSVLHSVAVKYLQSTKRLLAARAVLVAEAAHMSAASCSVDSVLCSQCKVLRVVQKKFTVQCSDADHAMLNSQ